MAKAHTETDFVQPAGELPMTLDEPKTIGEPGKPLYGNEGYVSDHRPRATRDTKHTQEEWLVEATEIKTVLERGDVVSYLTLEMLFLDAYDVIAAFVPPAARSKKDDDEKRDEPHKRER